MKLKNRNKISKENELYVIDIKDIIWQRSLNLSISKKRLKIK
jgi:hypothetical protein